MLEGGAVADFGSADGDPEESVTLDKISIKSSNNDPEGSYLLRYSGEGNDYKEKVIIPKYRLGGPGEYEVVVDYSLGLYARSGEADLNFYARTNKQGKGSGSSSDVRIADWSLSSGEKHDSGSKTFTLNVGEDDDGVVIYGYLDNEPTSDNPGSDTSYISAHVSAPGSEEPW